jgi:hypothetical protein
MQKKDFLLENRIYCEDIIKLSISDFSDFDIRFSESILTITWNSTEEIEEIFNEFMNYVIWMQNEII